MTEFRERTTVPTQWVDNTLYAWQQASLYAVCQSRVWYEGDPEFQFTEINVILGPAYGYATVLREDGESQENYDCSGELTCDGGSDDERNHRGVYTCYYSDYYSADGTYLYREYEDCYLS